jgi:putative tricarboxylic transport membrane protein
LISQSRGLGDVYKRQSVAFDNKKHLRAAVFGTLFITVIYFSFTHFLHVQLPAGILKGT